MGLFKKENLGIVDFISPRDSAIDTRINEQTGEPRSDLEKYKEDWDFDKYCVLTDGEEPTIFKINFSLTPKKQIFIDNSSLGGDGKKEQFGFKLGSHKYTIVKSVLVGIENPANTPTNQRFIFKSDGKGFVHDDTMNELLANGLVDEIYSFYLTRKEDPNLLKKK